MGKRVSYGVLVLPSAERELEEIPTRELGRVLARIELLSTQPRPLGVQKLRGSKDRYRIRQGRYRILFRIDETAKTVFVYSVGDRKDVHR